MQRRRSQRLASALDALENDLQVMQIKTQTEQDIQAKKTLDEYWGTLVQDEEEKVLLLGEQEEVTEAEQEEVTEACEEEVTEAEQEEGDTIKANIEQGNPGVEQFGSEATGDTDEVRQLGEDYGVTFDGDQALEDSIRQIPNRDEKIRITIAKLQKIANYLEKNGHTKLAYRIDVVCNNLEKYHLNK